MLDYAQHLAMERLTDPILVGAALGALVFAVGCGLALVVKVGLACLSAVVGTRVELMVLGGGALLLLLWAARVTPW